MPPSSQVCIRPSWRYLLVQIEQGEARTPTHLEPLLCRHLISMALERMYGLVGSAIPVDILRESDAQGLIVLRCPAGHETQLRTALSLFTSDPLGPSRLQCGLFLHGVYSTARDIILPSP
ncbi:hypothetical protein BJ684DRAFT_20937 [Piptocephalis cylindrospora]|uniref:Ribonucleases P/MRP subunit Pop8-like domain-containing protein n=1 Tax=Piptocephalis cylindrospora TaxID=1907219 RepID=A0A4P9Y1J4_9FUNG|nr:hypothetical protein BJ684DRAFT_20937 [Piptocephalis cylindrospora]|eukprot:RKP12534.1 hypothetical protein BJ684DRAFT_20937 [Piptocephalis cylindrospora]